MKARTDIRVRLEEEQFQEPLPAESTAQTSSPSEAPSDRCFNISFRRSDHARRFTVRSVATENDNLPLAASTRESKEKEFFDVVGQHMLDAIILDNEKEEKADLKTSNMALTWSTGFRDREHRNAGNPHWTRSYYYGAYNKTTCTR